jgi:hypothetical protein
VPTPTEDDPLLGVSDHLQLIQTSRSYSSAYPFEETGFLTPFSSSLGYRTVAYHDSEDEDIIHRGGEDDTQHAFYHSKTSDSSSEHIYSDGDYHSTRRHEFSHLREPPLSDSSSSNPLVSKSDAHKNTARTIASLVGLTNFSSQSSASRYSLYYYLQSFIHLLMH